MTEPEMQTDTNSRQGSKPRHAPTLSGLPIYLDTEALFSGGWPRPNQRLRDLSERARVLLAPLVLLEPVQIERNRQWLREYHRKIREVDGALKSATSSLQGVNAATMLRPIEPPSVQDVERAYATAELEAIEQLALVRGATTARPVVELFALAANKQLPFREGGSGFQDAVIALSVVDDLRSRRQSSALLVTANKRDFEPAIKVLAPDLKVAVVSLDEALLVLRLSAEMGSLDQWTRVRERASSVVEANRTLLERFATENLRFTHLDLGVFFGLREITSLRLSNIASVQVPFGHLPDRNEPIQLTILADLTVELLVDPSPAAILFRVGQGSDPDGGPPFPLAPLGLGSAGERLSTTVRAKFTGTVNAEKDPENRLDLLRVETTREQTLGEMVSICSGDARHQ